MAKFLLFEMKECTKLIARFLNFMNREEQFPRRSSLLCRTGSQQAYGFDPPKSFGRWNLEQEHSRMKSFSHQIYFEKFYQIYILTVSIFGFIELDNLLVTLRTGFKYDDRGIKLIKNERKTP